MSLILYSAEDMELGLSHGAILCTKEQADEYYLMHYRTKGSKNGERRYQDEQGRLTPEGYRHYAEMYGWGSRLKKAEKLQNVADQKSAKAESAARRSDEDVVKAYKANQKNERRTTDRRQMKADQANARSTQSRAEASKASLDARKAQDKATAYADKLARKDEKLSKYMDENGNLNEEALAKYTRATWLPGERKMSLVGRMKFGNEYSNKFNKEHASKMTNAEKQKFADDERAEFDRMNKAEDAQMDRAKKLATLDEVHNRVMSGTDNLSPKERKKLGDQALATLGESAKLFGDKESQKGTDYTNFTGLQDWLIDEVYNKAGSINAGDYKSGTNAAKAQEKVDETSRRMNEREDQVKKEINYQYDNSFGKKYQKEQARLRQALQKDSVWKSLDIEWEKNQDDVMGAILKDLGFSDTPRNRSILYAYGWWD